MKSNNDKLYSRTKMSLKNFILNPNSPDKDFAKASRDAIRSFANTIADTDKELANELRDWADMHSPALSDWPVGIDYEYYIEEWPLL